MVTALSGIFHTHLSFFDYLLHGTKLFKDKFDYFNLLLSRPFQYKNKATAFMKCVYIKVYEHTFLTNTLISGY